MRYRCEAVSVEGFIQQLAVAYVARGYFFYVTGRIPPGKDRRAVDEKLVERYQIDLSKWARARRKQLGRASVQYLRHENFFTLLATHGEHPFFEREGASVRDIRRRSLKYAGYAVSFRGDHVQVRIDLPQYRLLKAWFEEEATRRSAESLAKAFYELPFEPYYLVKQQEFNLLRVVNRRRKAAGLSLVPFECIWLKRRPVKPFGETRRVGQAPPGGEARVEPEQVATDEPDGGNEGDHS